MVTEKVEEVSNITKGTIGLYHPVDGVANPKYELLCSLTTKNFFAKKRRHYLLTEIGAAI